LSRKIYRNLRKHLDTLPIGFPKTISGVEKRILRYLFTPEEAQIATLLSIELRNASEILSILSLEKKEILKRLDIADETVLIDRLEKIAAKGLIFRKTTENGIQFANVPLVIGMFEFNINNLTLPFIKDVENYLRQGFAIEMINSQIPQLRTIPIETSLEPEQFVVPYDKVSEIINQTEEIITVADCICRKSFDMNKTPCSHTKLRETCINIGLMGERYLALGIGRKISKPEALDIIRTAEKDGLILQTMNAQTPQVICACCGDCCGTINILKRLPRPIDFTSSNYHCEVNQTNCIGCGVCTATCHMTALKLQTDNNTGKKTVQLNVARCIGCGICVSRCNNSALSLIVKDQAPLYTPATRIEMYEKILSQKKSQWDRIKMILKILLGKKN
jgi:H+/Na+-translocating ferredoxin:NAD+ oxidoreductase subunit B